MQSSSTPRCPHTRQRRGFTRLGAGAALAALTILLAGAPAVHARVLTDKDVTDAISDELFIDPAVASYRIDTAVEKGVATLKGSVNNILAKQRAQQIAERIKGVRSVINLITVSGTDRSDEEVLQDVRDALLYDAATESWEITPDVTDSVVILRGSVQSWQEKQLAKRIAMSVRGVQDVKNQIDVDFVLTRSDQEIREDVQRALDWDICVDNGMIAIGVNDQSVTLSGVVPSAAEKDQVIRDAWVVGAIDVNADDLAVESWTRDQRFRKSKYTEKPDSAIRGAVATALAYDPRVPTDNLTVETRDGIVTLRGWASSLKAKRSAQATARNTIGVRRVINRINIRPEQAINDLQIVRRVRGAIVRDPELNRYEVTANVVDGEVYLDGTVDSFFEKLRADEVAASVKGVVAVNNNLKVNEVFTSFAFDPYAFPELRLNDYMWFTIPSNGHPTKSDKNTRDDIQSQLFWSPFVDADDVTVSVVDGVARLTGTVDTNAEREAAVKNAFDGGAEYVNDDLLVRSEVEPEHGATQ